MKSHDTNEKTEKEENNVDGKTETGRGDILDPMSNN